MDAVEVMVAIGVMVATEVMVAIEEMVVMMVNSGDRYRTAIDGDSS